MAQEWVEDAEDWRIAPATNMAENADPPTGEQLFVVVSVKKVKDERDRIETFQQTADGMRKSAYFATKIEVRFLLKNDPSKSISDSFFLPPDEPSAWPLYFKGRKEDGKPDLWRANKFVQFIERIGFEWKAGEPMPELAQRPKNWIGREVFAKVERGADYTDSRGETKQGRLQLAMFSYRATTQAQPSQSQPQAAVASKPAPVPPANPAPQPQFDRSPGTGFNTDLAGMF